MLRSLRLVIYSLVFVFALSSTAFAAGTVGTGTPGSCTEAALDTALTGGGTVDFDCGGSPHTITLTGTKVISTATTVDGGGLITLDGDNSLAHFSSTVDLTLQNLTLQNGGNRSIVMFSGNLTITDSTLQNNSSSGLGGAIVGGTGNITISGSTFSQNSTTSNGGVLYADAGTVDISNTTFDQNSADEGGVFYIDGATLIIAGSTLEDNSSSSGGAIYVNSGTLTVTDSDFEVNNATSGGAFFVIDGTINVSGTTFLGNTSNNNGGALYIIDGTVDISESTFQQNESTLSAPAMYLVTAIVGVSDSYFEGNTATTGSIVSKGGSGTLTVERSVFENNTNVDELNGVISSGAGTLNLDRVAIVNNIGGMVLSASNTTVNILNSTFGDNTGTFSSSYKGLHFSTFSTVEINNSTIVNNASGGISANSDATVNVINSIIAQNDGSDCTLGTTGSPTIVSLDGNLDSDNTCGFGEANDLSGTDPLLNILSTVAHDDVTGDTRVYQPYPGSPIIDSGVVDLSNPTEDQIGIARPQDGDGDTNADIDRGAFEALTGVDVSPPILAEVTPPPASSIYTNPDYTFSSDEAGTIALGGSCSSADTAAVAGNNTITLDPLAIGYYDDCFLVVTDGSGNASEKLFITAFEILEPSSNTSGSGGAGGIVTTPSTPSSPTTNESCGGYSDVSASDPDCAAIEFAQSIEAMTGNDDGTFGPGDMLQRDQITKISLEAFGLFDDQADYCESTNPFPDVTSADWSYQYVCRGKQLGMITGYEAGENAGLFVPGNNVMLIEFWALILRNTAEELPLGSSFTGWVTDAWYSGYAKFVADNNLYDGLSPSPTETVPRRDVAVFLYELNQMGVL